MPKVKLAWDLTEEEIAGLDRIEVWRSAAPFAPPFTTVTVVQPARQATEANPVVVELPYGQHAITAVAFAVDLEGRELKSLRSDPLGNVQPTPDDVGFTIFLPPPKVRGLRPS